MEIDARGGRVRYRDLASGSEGWESFDTLLVATGALPVCPRVPGSDLDGIHGVCGLQAAVDLRARLDERNVRHAVVVGGGYIGLEMAEALLSRGIRVTLVDRGPEIMTTLDPEMAALLARELEARGAEVRRNEGVEGFEGRDGRVTAVVTAAGAIPCDVVVLGTGVRPNTALAGAAGIPLGVHGAISVDERMRTGVENIFAAGDCADSFHLITKQRVHIALGTVANRHGRVAGITIAGGDAVFPGVVGTAVTKICDLEVARTGLHEREATAAGFDPISTVIASTTHAPYYPGAMPISVKLVAERNGGRLLGGQIVGGTGSAKRIDVLATALYGGFTLPDLVNLDLSYAPPFSNVWDPVQVAARELLKKSTS